MRATVTKELRKIIFNPAKRKKFLENLRESVERMPPDENSAPKRVVSSHD